MKQELTAEYLREVLDYDPETGVFRWRRAVARNTKAGQEAGVSYPQKGGVMRRRIGVGYGRYLAHRLAWLYVHGEWPAGEIDHVNGDPLDNRIVNLRPATRSQQMLNRRVMNTSGYKGVSYWEARGKWRAQIRFNGRNKTLGYFLTVEEAAEAYLFAALEHHGDFARFQ
jgi:hypothetical protein